MSKSCVICGTEESEGELLLEAPCGRHWVCADDIGSFFENATNNESLFPPQCCGTMFMLKDYEDYVPFEMTWAYQIKQQGEYSILAKFRIYCANLTCGKFLHPGSHVEDPETKITYAICEAEGCGKLTCVKCRALLDQGTQNHECKQNEDEKKFKQTANEKGYQECFVCGATVELAEACNHITCECGNSFCYICGENWPGLHGCPHYGPAVYDEEGYNQDGYHRDSGLNREGLTRRQEMIRLREEDEEEGEDDDDEGEDEDDEGEDPEWEVLQHLTPDQRAMINQLPHGPREDALDQFRITLFETQGITFDQFAPQPPPPPPEEFGDDGDAWEDEQDEADENHEGQDEDLLLEVRPTIQIPADPVDEDEAPADVGGGQDQIDGREIQEDMVPVVLRSDDEDNVDPWHGYEGEYTITNEEGIQQGRFADDQSEGSDSDTVTPPVDRTGEETNQRAETASAVDPASQLQQVPASFPTGGPYRIVARGFVSGTTVHDIEAVINRHGARVIGRRLMESDPVIVQLQIATQQDAENIIATFHGLELDGQVLDVRMEDEDL